MKKLLIAAAAALSLAPLAAQAVVFQFNAALNAGNEVGVSSDTGTGIATLFYNDMGTANLLDDKFDFSMSTLNLSTGPATGFHIHAPGAVGVNAGVVVNLALAPFVSLVSGGTLLVGGSGVTPPASFLANLQAGLAYVNVHTAANAGGAIRGQLMQVAVVPEPATYGMLALGLLGIGAVVRRRRQG